MIIVGDFNAPDVDWSTLSHDNSQHRISPDLCDFVFDHNMSQLVAASTHIKGNILDLILCSNDSLINDVKVYDHPHPYISSDHFVLSFSVFCRSSFTSVCPSSYYFPVYSKTNFQAMTDYLIDVDFDILDTCSDVESMWICFKSIISAAMDFFVPKVRIRREQYPKWFTPLVRHRIKCLRTLRRKCRSNPTG